MKKYKNEFLQYYQTTQIPSNCNGITFINTGTINVEINKFILVPGASISLSGNADELDTTDYNVSFGGATDGSVAVIKKMFV